MILCQSGDIAITTATSRVAHGVKASICSGLNDGKLALTRNSL